MNSSGSSVSASSARATCSRSRGSSASLRRCSTTARASGLLKRRSGSTISIGALRPGLAGQVLGHQRQLHLHAGPEMVADLVEALALGLLGVGARQPQRQRRRALVGRTRALLGAGAGPGGRGLVLLGADAADAAFGGDDAVVVLDLEGELQRAARGALGLLGQGDLGRIVGRDHERPAQQRRAAAVDRDGARLAHLELELGDIGGAGRRRRLEALRRAVVAGSFERERTQRGAGPAHDQHAAVGDLHRTGRLLLRPQAAEAAVGQHDGRLGRCRPAASPRHRCAPRRPWPARRTGRPSAAGRRRCRRPTTSSTNTPSSSSARSAKGS